MSGYLESMQQLHQSKQDYRQEWKKWREGKLKHKQKLKLKKLKDVDPQAVTVARDKFTKSFNKLYGTKIYPLEIKFQSNPSLAIDEIIEFLSADVLAFRCGYAKEFFLTKLKRSEMNPEQKQNLRQIMLTYCEAQNFHREFRHWCRLAIIIADENVVFDLKKLSESPNKYAQIKSKWVLKTINNHRKDLAQALISSSQ